KYFFKFFKKCMLPITLGENERKYLASQKEITIDLPNQTVSANDKSFNFQIDETWKHKLVNGLDDIAITLEYEDLIEQYENKNKG
ncbi:3-isopropylmalate dehydratase small subunit, partial [Staphylococcus haemolyticus]|nr:3-isopropylmalate dehydratase small subunit [Staphylococcus haemolyticus]